MRRRDFMALLGGAAAACAALPIDTHAQAPARVRRVGYIAGSPEAAMGHTVAAFRQGLADLGYLEGQSHVLEIRFADGGTERYAEFVTELIGLKVDVLVVTNSVIAVAARQATSTIPIVMVAADPVGLGLVESLARPGGNVTGLSYFNEQLIAKRLQLLQELVPGLSRIAVIKNPARTIHAAFWRDTEAAARTLRLALQPLEVSSPEDFDAAFASATADRAQGLVVFDDVLTVAHRPRIVALAASHRLPAMYGLREFPRDGGLISYGASFAALFRRAATYVDKILKGTRPADIPVEQPTTFELIINRKTANALGLAVPATLLAQADEVIE
jgi:putative ABC transport system substrate-binding protein